MCPQCHYLTDILLEITDDNARLRQELVLAKAVRDAEQILNLQWALEETVTQVQIAQNRMNDHLAVDHAPPLIFLKTAPIVGPRDRQFPL